VSHKCKRESPVELLRCTLLLGCGASKSHNIQESGMRWSGGVARLCKATLCALLWLHGAAAARGPPGAQQQDTLQSVTNMPTDVAAQGAKQVRAPRTLSAHAAPALVCRVRGLRPTKTAMSKRPFSSCTLGLPRAGPSPFQIHRYVSKHNSERKPTFVPAPLLSSHYYALTA
jgi:hypothetical protein